EAEVAIGDAIDTYEFVLDRNDRANYDYVLTLPAQPNHTSGTLTVILADEHGNSTEVGPVELHWDYQRPMLYETFEECDILSIPEGWSTSGNPTWWDWSVLGAMHYTDYYGSEYEVAPHGGQRHAVLEWDSSDEASAQDQTLVTPVLSITRPTVLEFWTWVQYGLDGFDHFAVRVYDTYNGTWEDKWDAADQPSGQVNAYNAPISINLDEYIGRNIKIGFRGYNTFGEFLAFDWFVDDVKVIVTDTIEVPPTGIVEPIEAAVSLYPNPVKDRLHVDSDRTIRQLQVIDVNGVMIENKKVNVNQIDLDLAGYPKGCYFLRLVTDEGVVTKPIVLSE
ncbi:MAG: T9SS type A sorting domain-containing protein, partial [Bacteroidales bacterium]|nr:T9SS type A sorting domain-containing protein [Bacteroidales bacterium]